MARKAKGGDAASAADRDVELLELYRRMLIVRRAEERLSQMFADGEVPGFIHLSIGQEAVPVGVCAALRLEDTLASNHRGHGHALAKGLDLERFFLEVMGRAEGVCGGRGGSMHIADMGVGMLGANGIVGAGLPIAAGSALAHQVRRTGGVAVAFLGDGAMAEGTLHETLNLAALWHLPMLFVCEDNGWGEFSPTSRQFTGDLIALAGAFGIDAATVDGNDVAAVARAASKVVAAARDGCPQVLRCVTNRVHGHYEGDPQRYRDPADLEALPNHDPLRRCAAKLGADDVAKVTAEVEDRIAAAVAAARAGTEPDIARARADVYSPCEAAHG